MSDETPFLDEGVEQLLRSSAVWETPGDGVVSHIDDTIGLGQPGPSTPLRAWILSGIAAAVVVFAALASLATAPDWRVEIVAGDGASASGEILGFNEPTGTRVVLEIRDLPPAAPGTFYEVWWVRDGGESVSSGSFLRADDVEMWMGIRRAEFPRVLITLEPSDGNPAPSDDIVAHSVDS